MEKKGEIAKLQRNVETARKDALKGTYKTNRNYTCKCVTFIKVCLRYRTFL